jgi:hypothetical protein
MCERTLQIILNWARNAQLSSEYELHLKRPDLILKAGKVDLRTKVSSHSRDVYLLLKEPQATILLFCLSSVPL